MVWNSSGFNETLDGEGFYVSYLDVGKFVPGLGVPETTLVKDTKVFEPIRKDLRKEFEELVPKGWEACYNFYIEQGGYCE